MSAPRESPRTASTSLAEISRIYDRGGSSAILAEECQTLQARLRIQLSGYGHSHSCSMRWEGHL